MAIQIKVHDGELSQNEIDSYLDELKKQYPDRQIHSVEFRVDGAYVDVKYRYESVPFHRIRRITGYLVGTLDRFNNAKRAEEKDRVKHEVILDECDCGCESA